ncbi:unnamed protein product [Zymoseptoria tritici ST99CH_1E4]|uniref:Inner centromere protein ARK-binding domain-containing protein n=1 Tax=Zymoseptoria tritici ST99CH_1E4 TaxID=1276532 RepID=A0A2H1GBR0_ZYMTR|nr:unnamed protein product [Zymoseptoria tritici ST99CH_1E4]
MAAMRQKAPAIGSSQWIQDERDQAENFIAQEADEFSFSARNELEWLNEHMADIFSTSQVNFADMFKTPGKLRGKTPRTARKRDVLAPRQPLTDIFAPNSAPAAPVSAQKNSFYDKIAPFQISEDAPNQQQALAQPVARGTSPQRAGKPWTDSGYHGMMTEDEMDPDTRMMESVISLSQIGETQKVPLRDDQPPAQRLRDGKGGDETGDDSFVSAKEHEDEVVDEEMDDAHYVATQPDDLHGVHAQHHAEADVLEEVVAEVQPEQEIDNEVDMDMEAPSDTSSPEQPLNRKSSFTFSSLPAREPLGAKRSMGHMERHRSSVFNKSIGSKNVDSQEADDEMSQEKRPETKAHSKSTAQLLHDRINMLNKTKEPRPSKSIPLQPTYPQLPEIQPVTGEMDQTFNFEFAQNKASQDAMDVDDEDDDWIAPSKPRQSLHEKTSDATIQARTLSPPRPTMHQKSMSAHVVGSPRIHTEMGATLEKSTSIPHPDLAAAMKSSTTPAGSPYGKKQTDGPLSASKNRLWSALKSAKNIFASSASTSAAAKLEAYNQAGEEEQGTSVFNMPGAMQSRTETLRSPARTGSVISFSPSRKTRSSDESQKKREKEMKAQKKADDELEKMREKERAKALKQQQEEQAKAEKVPKAEAIKAEKEKKKAAAERPESADGDKVSNDEGVTTGLKSSILGAGKLRAPGRIVRPTTQSKPQPVSIKVASQSQRFGHNSQASLSRSTHESMVPPASKDGPSRPPSAMAGRGGPSAPGNSRVKALEAAARKKEADERVAAKKAEQKKELERKRAAKVEEDKRVEEERKAAEQQRAQEAKLAAQRKLADKQAAESRKREQERQEQQRREQERQEQQRRDEQHRREQDQLRRDEEARRAREAHELAESIKRERAQQQQAHPRSDLPGTLRQLTKTILSVAPTGSKPAAKRQLDDEEQFPQPPQRPGIMRGPASYQQTDAKRRRTIEEQEEANPRASVMAPPKRPSTMRKETITKFNHGYTHAPPPAAHHSLFKSNMASSTSSSANNNKPLHPSQLVQMSTARIPFAESAASSSTQQQLAQHPPHHYQQQQFKTPARPAAHALHPPKSAPRTTPLGDHIDLPDIATDSEDEDSDASPQGGNNGGFRAPSWVASPALRDLLTQQQLVDPETVFGPIGELKMDEVFRNGAKGNVERLKRFRERGSSALWHETGDAVTSAEKRRDREGRERVVREGGWRYDLEQGE